MIYVDVVISETSINWIGKNFMNDQKPNFFNSIKKQFDTANHTLIHIFWARYEFHWKHIFNFFFWMVANIYGPMFIAAIWRKLSTCDTHSVCCFDKYMYSSDDHYSYFMTTFRKKWSLKIFEHKFFSSLSLSHTVTMSLIAKTKM